MLISQFADEVGLSVDTVRYYVRRGLLTPEIGRKGGSNPYQIFTTAHVDSARAIRMAQSLGFSLTEIAALADEYRAGAMTADKGAKVLQDQIAKLEVQADQLDRMLAYMRAKLAWINAGNAVPEPRLQTFLKG